ncbi:MAG TPA: hypothetical protein VGF51_11515 [Acidimicrobiales bacterium]|jgi:hypothetical protein
MEAEGARAISYEALEVGTPVVTSSGTEFGKVEHVLQIPSLDLFDGLVVKTHHHDIRFVDRDQIEEIWTNVVRCSISDDQIESLPAPHGTLAARPDPARDEGASLTAWWGRHFRREHWKEI